MVLVCIWGKEQREGGEVRCSAAGGQQGAFSKQNEAKNNNTTAAAAAAKQSVKSRGVDF